MTSDQAEQIIAHLVDIHAVAVYATEQVVFYLRLATWGLFFGCGLVLVRVQQAAQVRKDPW